MLNDSLIDKRTVERNIQKGKVDAAEYRRTLDALPDLRSRVWRREEQPQPVVAAPPPPPPAAPPPPPAAPPPPPAAHAQPEPEAHAQPEPEAPDAEGDEPWSDGTSAQSNPFG
jgi:hypothetical protein